MYHWLLDVLLDGETLRLSETDLDVTKDDGTVLHYFSAVVVDPVQETFSLLSADAAQPEAQLRIWFDRLAPLALLRASGELSRWKEGTTYERRRRAVAGRFQSPEGDSIQEGVSTTLSDDAWLDPESLLPADGAVNDQTFVYASTVLDAGQNLRYPIVIGHPGRTTLNTAGWVPAMVCLWCDQDQSGITITGSDTFVGYKNISFVVAGHACKATRVRVSSDNVGGDYIARLMNTTDSVGQPIAVLPWFATSVASPIDIYYDNTPGHYTFRDTEGSDYVYGMGKETHSSAYNTDTTQPPVYASFEDTYLPASGGLSLSGTVIREAGDVLSYVLSLSGAKVDRSRMSDVLGTLSAYSIDTVIAETVSPWDWVVNVLLPILPISLVGGADGVYAVPVLLDVGIQDVECLIDTRRPDISRVSSLKWDTTRLVRSVSVSYCYNVQTYTYLGTVKYTGRVAAREDATKTSRSHPTLTLAEAWGCHGEDYTVSTAAVYDDSTAALIASTIARIRGLPTGSVSYSVPEDEFSNLRRGSIVLLYDDELGLDRVAQVSSITTGEGDGSLTVGLLLILDPSRDTDLL